MNWFEKWFDSPLYEKLYADRDEKEAARLVDLLESTLPLKKCSKVLDLGCGRGRHAINLYKKGCRVTGIDLSEQAIATARQKAAGLDGEKIRFKVRDMRNPLPETFDVIVNLFTTFGYFDSEQENVRVLDSVSRMLNRGGIFVLDYLNAVKVRKSIQPSEEGTFQGIDYKIRRYVKNNAVYKEIEFRGDQVTGTKKFAEHVKLYELPWFRKQLSKQGFEIIRIYGDYRGNDFDPVKSDRLLMISCWEPKGKRVTGNGET